jgi:hypothetical protein
MILAGLLTPADFMFAEDGAVAPPRYEVMRHDEDYSYLADGSLAHGWLDRVKYIPLSGLDARWFLTLGGSFRFRYERFEHEDFDPANHADGSLLQRYLLLGDLHLGRRFRLFTQLQSSLENGRDGGPRPTDEDKLDLHEAFVETPLGASDHLLLRIGRQELSFGTQRLVSVRKGPNVMRTFDAIAVVARPGHWRLDAFFSHPVQTDPGTFDDGSDTGKRFWGAYAVGPLGKVKGGHIDLYYLGLDREDAQFDQGAAPELRESFGTRIWGRGKMWDYNTEIVAQWGRFGSARIRAWTFASDTGLTLHDAAWGPRFGIKADITSGDRDRNDPALETFNPLFPRGSYFGEDAIIGPMNHVDLHPSVDLRPHATVTITPSWSFFWRESLEDGVYDVGTNLFRSGAGSHARYVGNQPSLMVTWSPNRHVTAVIDFERFLAGSFISDTGTDADVSFAAAWVEVTF